MLASSLAWFLVPGEICIWCAGDDRVTVQRSAVPAISRSTVSRQILTEGENQRQPPGATIAGGAVIDLGHHQRCPTCLLSLPIQHYHHFSNTEYSSVHCSEEEFT